MISPLQLHHGPKRIVSTTDICAASSGDFMKSHAISPDGSQILLSSESNYISCWQLGETPGRTRYYGGNKEEPNGGERGDVAISSVFNMGESIYDYAWHPYIDPTTELASYFVCSTKDHPVHMMDIETGSIRCSYLGYNHLDELDPAFSVALNLDATKIYTGGNRVIR